MRIARLVLVRREDLDHVAAHAERAAVEVDVVALVLDVDQLPQELVAPELLALLELDEQAVVALGRADAVDAAHADATMITSRRESSACVAAWRMRSICVVDDRVLLDERVARRDVRLGLVVVVVADEVLDRVVRERAPASRRRAAPRASCSAR